MSTKRIRLSLLISATVLAGVSGSAQQDEGLSPPDGLVASGIVGYADRLSVQPGETIQFMVSSQLPEYEADIVRLIHGDPNPRGPGIKERLIDSPVSGEYAGRHQELVVGSYVTVPDAPALQMDGSFTITAWIAATRPGQVGWANERAAQGIVTKWSEADGRGYGLFLDADGRAGGDARRGAGVAPLGAGHVGSRDTGNLWVPRCADGMVFRRGELRCRHSDLDGLSTADPRASERSNPGGDGGTDPDHRTGVDRRAAVDGGSLG